MNKSLSFTIFISISIILLLCLGSWQIYRLQWKESLITQLKVHMNKSPLRLPLIENLPSEELYKLEYWPLLIKGYYLYSHEYKLQGRTFNGKAGYHLITPFLCEGDTVIIVDRGWVPAQERSIHRPLGNITIKGYIRFNSNSTSFTPDNNYSTKELYSINISEFRKNVPFKGIKPFYISLSENIMSHPFPLSKPPSVNLRNFHLAYAITWYSLALGLGILYFLYRRKKI